MHFEDLVAAYSRLPWIRRKPALVRLVNLAERWRGTARSGKTAIIATPAGRVRLEVDLGKWLQRQIFYYGAFEPETQACLQRLCPPGAVAVDVGANIGVYTVQFSRLVGVEGKVYAFEPTAGFQQRLQENLALNGCHNVVAEKLIVSNDSQPRDITMCSQTASINLYPGGGPSETVAAVTLDEYFAGHQERVDLIKIDVDGWDYYVLLGAKRVIRRHRPTLIVECINYGPVAPDAMWQLLDELGYSIRSDVNVDCELSLTDFGACFVASRSVNIVAFPRETLPS